MPTKSRRFTELAAAFGLLGAAIASGVALAAPSKPAPIDMETGFRAAYPELDPARVAPITTASYAGVAIDSLGFPGLHVRAREDHPSDRGGISISYEDQHGNVQVLLDVAVGADSGSARAFADRALRSVSTTLPKAGDPTLGDVAWADGGTGDSIAIGVIGNVGYRVHIVGKATTLHAAGVVKSLRAAMAPGAPVFPSIAVKVDANVPKSGAPIAVSVPAGLVPALRAEGGYVVRGPDGVPRVRAYQKTVTVIATVTDSQGRVSEARATSTATP